MRQHKTFYVAGSGIIMFLIFVTVIALYRQHPSAENPDGRISTNPARQTGTNSSPNNSISSNPKNFPQKQSDIPSWSFRNSVENLSLQELLNLGRELAQKGDAQALQHIFGKALLRYIQQDIQAILPLLLAALNDPLENTLLRKTILEALMWVRESLSAEDKKSLFALSMQMMQHESAADLRSAALHAAASMMNALQKQNLLSEDDGIRFSSLALQFVEDRTEPELLRRSAITELTSLNNPALPALLQSILTAQNSEPVNLVRCAAVALADLQQTAALPEMISLLQQTPDQNLFLSLAYAIAQLDSDAGLAALVTNASRHEGTCQPYIGRYLGRIEKNLKNGDGEAFVTAVEAIQFLPELVQRQKMLEQAISAGTTVRNEISPEAARALLTLVADLGTPSDCAKTLALLGEDARWQNEWQQVQDRSRAQSGHITGYKKTE